MYTNIVYTFHSTYMPFQGNSDRKKDFRKMFSKKSKIILLHKV